MKHELEAMIVLVSNEEAEIDLLKTDLLKVQIEGPGTKVVQKLQKFFFWQRLLLFKRR